MYLLDTNIVSETRKPRPHGGVMAWLQAVPKVQRHLSALTLGELQAGVEDTRKNNPTKADEIEGWINRLAAAYKILPADDAIFRRYAILMVGKPKQLEPDALIAATALIHDLTIVTRNVRDFATLGLAVVNPFEAQ